MKEITLQCTINQIGALQHGKSHIKRLVIRQKRYNGEKYKKQPA
jgi:hypothetical protein